MLIRLTTICTFVLTVLTLLAGTSAKVSAADPLDSWKPNFDPSGAEYTYVLSNIAHPGIAGIGVGYHIRDKVWEKSNGRLYVDFRPLAQLGGEKDVIRKLKMGAVQGMLCSSVAAANVAPKLGVVNLPFVVDTFDKLDTFRNTPDVWDEYRNSAQRQGLMVLDITGYGTYGWATTKPVKKLDDAGKINFRIAQAPVNTDIYKSWDLKFTVMPWPDVPQALQTGVITGLDHTPIVCNITKKFTVAKHFTRIDYAQGLFVHLTNKRWYNKLPEDLQQILDEVVTEESAKARVATRLQQQEQIAAAREAGVSFYELAAAEKQQLIANAETVYKQWGEKIGPEYLLRVRTTLGD
jgi:TRAP-type C4-dicarboxylate transport system substrate-binding protein